MRVETVVHTNVKGEQRKYLRLTSEKGKGYLVKISDAQEREITNMIEEEEESKKQLKLEL